MMKFKRIDDYIVDLEDMHLVNVDKGNLYQFDFNDMVVRKITHQSKAAFPIRYDEQTDSMMIWKQRRWQQINEGQKAIMFMFNHRIERAILD